jgi:hypothetical protein
MLSAVLQLLQVIGKEVVRDRRQAIIDVCAAAYPDVRPWQVESACRPFDSADSGDDLYYLYLSMLLHPMDGHDIARRDPALVKVRIHSSPSGSHWPGAHVAHLLVHWSGMV